jgi:HAE1 family hydrophobic/amphiphilic exporter-1
MNLVEFSVRRRVTVLMVTLTFVLFGVIGLSSLPVNLLPDLSYPTLTVRTEYTGAAPSEIETLISEPVEEAVGVVKGLRKLKSVSRTGQSDVVLEFAWGTDMDRASLEVRDKLEALRLPLEAKQPVLLRFNPSTEPIVRLTLSASDKAGAADANAELVRLRRFADDELKKLLEPVEGVAAVKVSGGLEDEIQVHIDQQKLAQLNLGIGTVIDRLKAENVNISGGRIEDGSQRYLVRTINQFSDIEQMRDLLITARTGGGGNSAAQEAAAAAARVAALTGSAEALAASASAQSAASGSGNSPGGGQAIRLRDIATVVQGHKEREAIIRLDGREAVELAIYKEGDANTVTVADAIKKTIERIRSEIPADAQLDTVDDQSIFIKSAIGDVQFDAVIGGVLAILIIFFFLRDGWSTFVISLSLPISLIATFFFMDQFDLSLNVMSLGGLALATGLVVDDSIVVLESIAKARERGLGILEAAIIGTKEVSMAVVASTLTIVAVFLPLVFVEGVAGQLFKDQALTISIAILMSLIVAMTLIPMLSSLKARAPLAFPTEPPHPDWRPQSRVLKPIAAVRRGTEVATGGVLTGLSYVLVSVFRFLRRYVGGAMVWLAGYVMKPYDWAAAAYHRSLPKALDRPGLVLGAATLAFAGALALVPTLGLDLIPQLAQDRFEMTVKLPAGTQLRDTDSVVRAVQEAHVGDPGVKALYAVSGSGTRLDANPTESGENVGKITVVMVPEGAVATEAAETARLRGTMEQRFPGAEIKFGRPEIFSFSTPLEIELQGADLGELEAAGAKLVALMQKSDRFVDIKSTVEEGFPEIQIRFDQERAAALGLTTRQIADQVVRKVRGEVATRYSFRDRKIDVLVRSQEADRASIEDIKRLIVNPESAAPVTLAAVADVVATTGPSEIHHANQTRVAVVSSDLAHGDLGSAVAEIQALVAENPLGAGVSMHVGGQGEELRASMMSLLFAFGLAIFLVYLVMASQFESLLHPFVILFTIPLAVVGAVLALVLSGSSLSVVVFIGLILLVGIVVKNAIILIDKVNQLREQGVGKRDAIIRGAESRLRPIVMTTLTALLGFLPLALATGAGAEVRSPMAITVIGGLAVSTLLTLLVIPVVYNLLDRRSDESYVARTRPLNLDSGDETAEEGARA